MTINVKVIDSTSPYLSEVKALWKTQKAKLGFFPDGAFNDHAAKRKIIVALNADNECVGYLLYRTSGEKVMIAHLCVNPNWQRKGIAKKLLESLKQSSRDFRGIGLRCRRDYPETKLWPKLNFIPLSDTPGRGSDGEFLTYWWLDHGHPTLFSTVEKERLESKLSVVIDANIFFDIYSEDRLSSEESKALQADWLQPNLDLYLTDEIHNEINRHKDIKERTHQHKLARSLPFVHNNPKTYEATLQKLKELFPNKTSESDESDIRQLAKTITSEFQFFVTRDNGLLEMSEEISNNFNVSVIRPVDLICHFDELLREAEYQPARLSGTGLQIKLTQSSEIGLLTEYFQCSREGESKGQFQQKMHYYLSGKQNFICYTVLDNDVPQALVVYNKEDERILEVPIIRTGNSPLAATIARHMILKVVLDSNKENRKVTKITDQFYKDVMTDALHESTFKKYRDGWVKISLSMANKAETIAEHLKQLTADLEDDFLFVNSIIETLKNTNSTRDTQLMLDIERGLWPAKILDANIPTFIVPIQPRWAKELFDEELANQILFPAKAELALAQENVYYKSKRNSGSLTIGRILWYVSGQGSYYGSKHIRACSYIDEINLGKPKALFKQYSRLGIYEWDDVFKLAKSNIENEILAIRFSNTELFNRPVSWSELQGILSKRGKRSQIQSPVKINSSTFQEIYTLGTSSGKGL